MIGADLGARMAEVAAATEAELEHLLRDDPAVPPLLQAAMRYATLRAGKRLRPFLVHAAASLGQADPVACRRVGAAVELVHCYSLVHDDLPAMDDADLRRGKPACHKAYGEAVAILAGDALNALAFDVLAATDWPAPAAVRVDLMRGLATASGMTGMCGGQILDLFSGDAQPDEPALIRLQALKTGALIAFALDAGASLGGLDGERRRAVAAYAHVLGLAFQIRDDVLDLVGETGKPTGRDAALGRTTFVTLLGQAGAEARLTLLKRQGIDALTGAAIDSSLLGDLFDFVITRRS